MVFWASEPADPATWSCSTAGTSPPSATCSSGGCPTGSPAHLRRPLFRPPREPSGRRASSRRTVLSQIRAAAGPAAGCVRGGRGGGSVSSASTGRVGPGHAAGRRSRPERRVTPGATVQLIARNLAQTGDDPRTVRVALRARDGRSTFLPVVAARRYSVLATLPATVAPGEYEVWVHSGRGGPAAWGGGFTLRVKAPASWPAAIVNVRGLGARGDDVTDDSQVFRTALETATRHGGGVVYFPAGTYRLAGTFPPAPARGGARGRQGPHLAQVAAGSAPHGRRLHSDRARRDRGVRAGGPLAHGAERPAPSFGARHRVSPAPPLSGMGRGSREARGRTRDVFLRRVRIHYLPYSGRPSDHAQSDPQWLFARWGIGSSTSPRPCHDDPRRRHPGGVRLGVRRRGAFSSTCGTLASPGTASATPWACPGSTSAASTSSSRATGSPARRAGDRGGSRSGTCTGPTT